MRFLRLIVRSSFVAFAILGLKAGDCSAQMDPYNWVINSPGSGNSYPRQTNNALDVRVNNMPGATSSQEPQDHGEVY
jgi:hypothetical protein